MTSTGHMPCLVATTGARYDRRMTSIRPPTQRQREIILAILQSVETIGVPPTLRELCAALGLTSVNTVEEHMQRLVTKGLIRRMSGMARAVVVTEAGKAAIGAGDV
jgi:repressor LexA